MDNVLNNEGITVIVHRYGFRPGYYAEARNDRGERVAFTGVFRGPGAKKRATDAALEEARTGQPAKGDAGCPG